MNTAVRLEHVTKRYESFTLDNINLEIPKGSIVGLVGENGAGKTTMLKCILGMIETDAGTVHIEGQNLEELPDRWKEDVGVILPEIEFAGTMNARELGRCMNGIYENWQKETYKEYLEQFHIEEKKKISEYSKGMKMKLNLAIALSHNPRLLILDEATSGLDPVVRDDILDILLEFIQDENHTVLVSSHIIGDLEKVADYIAFLHDGHLKFYLNKDELLYEYGIVHCSEEEYRCIPKEFVQGLRKHQFGMEVLVDCRARFQREFPKYAVDGASIEEIILLLVKGEQP